MPKTTSKLPTEGKRAPEWTLVSDEGRKLSLSSLKGAPVVMYFYPKDNTPGCTVEAQEFRDLNKNFEKLGVRVIGLSPDSVETHGKFIAKQGLNFSLLADTGHKVAEKYGVWVEKNMYGRKYWGVQRATFLIGTDGKITKIWPKVRPKGHAHEVLEAVKGR